MQDIYRSHDSIYMDQQGWSGAGMDFFWPKLFIFSLYKPLAVFSRILIDVDIISHGMVYFHLGLRFNSRDRLFCTFNEENLGWFSRIQGDAV